MRRTFFFNDTATTEIYTLSLHDALPILDEIATVQAGGKPVEIWFADEARVGQKNKITRRWAKRGTRPAAPKDQRTADRKSTRLNSSHANISYAVFCLKKKIRMLNFTHTR